MSGLKPSILTVGKFLFYSVSEHGITFTPETPRDEWLDVLKRLTGLHEGAVMTRERTLMLLADALNFGEDKFGEEFAQAIDGTRQALGLTPKTVSNAKWAYGKVPSSFRKDGLTLGHYIAVAALPNDDQEKFITEALKGNYTVSDFKKRVAEVYPKTAREKPKKTIKATIDEAEAREAASTLNTYLTGLDINDLPSSWKPILDVPYKIYRRRFMKKARKK